MLRTYVAENCKQIKERLVWKKCAILLFLTKVIWHLLFDLFISEPSPWQQLFLHFSFPKGQVRARCGPGEGQVRARCGPGECQVKAR